ncbi:MAG TPA: response regulator [Candidatus Sulfopaludibacter sp.]|nr:response regulator [Candidatus Sulfopaludibacter sp.]
MADQQPTAQPKILVADDNRVILKAVRQVLEANGYQVVTATDGAAVVNIVDREIPDLILLDILFPPDAMDVGMHWDGFAIMRWLRNMSEARRVPIIIISGTEPGKYESLSLAAGAQAFLHKPLDMGELITTVRLVLGESITTSA